MKKKVFLMLPCIAAVAIATVVGKNFFYSHADEENALLMENVEALSAGGEGVVTHFKCEGTKGICYVIDIVTVIDGKLTK
ncbi:MAG: hypothetical protein J6I52_02645 [Prevotella sp.]|nr:hypothetical protein [Prevotella sp.]